MKQSYFQFKQFTVNQAQSAMKVSTDACIFGAWIRLQKPKQILDIGAGTGLLSLMLAQRSSGIIWAFEIDPKAAEEAHLNVQASPWATQIKVLPQDIKQFCPASGEKFEHIVSNPPFYEQHWHSPNSQKNLAFHSTALSHEELLSKVQELLSSQGLFSVLLAHHTQDRFLALAQEKDLWPQRIAVLRSSQHKKPHRVMLDMGFEKRPEVSYEDLWTYNDQHEYSPHIRSLLQDYYLYL